MHKNESLYYCYLPNTKSEEIISVPKMLESYPGFLYGCLYEVDTPLGQALFEAMDLAEKVISADEVKSCHTIADATMYDCFERMEFNPSPAKRLLRRYVANMRRSSADVDCLHAEVELYNDFIEQCINGGTPCAIEDLEKFCRKFGRGMKSAEIVQLDLEDYFDKVGKEETTDDTLDILLKSFPLTDEEREKLRQEVAPYMDSPRKFCETMKDWLLKYDPSSELIITYHIYKLDTLHDLFSATIKKIVDTKGVIKRCIQCKKLFVTSNRSDERCCSLRCKEARANELAECRRIYDIIRNTLSTAYETKPRYNEFLDDNEEVRDAVKRGEKSTQAYKIWLLQVRDQKTYE